MLDALDDSAIRATIFFCGRAVERSPALARAVVARGHEPAVHGWRWRPHADYEDARGGGRRHRRLRLHHHGRDRRCARRLLLPRRGEPLDAGAFGPARLSLHPPTGFDDDLPYWDRAPGRPPLLVVPYALDSNDMKFFHPNGFVRAREMVEYVTDALDVLEAEAARGLPRLLNLRLPPEDRRAPGALRRLSRHH